MKDAIYPIGKYEPGDFSEAALKERLVSIESLPSALEHAVINLDAAQLELSYREGGWNIRQIVHHVADSHLNAYCRFKLGYTEDNPSIKPYDQDAWSVLADVKNEPINISLTLLHALHRRWHRFLLSITKDDWENKTVFHPEYKKEMTLWYLLGMYTWHGKHHTAQINALRERESF